MILIFWVIFGGKMDVATMRALMCPGPQNPTKKLVHLKTYWVNHYLGKVFLKVSGLDPPLIYIDLESWIAMLYTNTEY